MKNDNAPTSHKSQVILCVVISLLVASWSISLIEVNLSVKVLWPALVALLTILIFKQAVLGLFLGALAGCIILTDGNLLGAFKDLTSSHFFPSMQGPWRVGAILFTLVLGSFAVVIEKGGGLSLIHI